jgi:preprotein translocase SecE subunit
MRHAVSVKPSSTRFRIFGETLSELKKVTWLTRRDVFYLTLLVLIMAAAAGVVLGALDFGFTRLAGVFIGG